MKTYLINELDTIEEVIKSLEQYREPVDKIYYNEEAAYYILDCGGIFRVYPTYYNKDRSGKKGMSIVSKDFAEREIDKIKLKEKMKTRDRVIDNLIKK